MPEFRFRRKKHQHRRHTVHDADEAQKQVKAAKQQIREEDKQAKPEPSKRDSLVQEREKFFELLKNKYPEQANDLEVQQVLSNGEVEHVDQTGLLPTSARGTRENEELNGHAHGASNGPMDFTDDIGIITTTSSSKLPSIKASVTRKISNTFNECLFLQHGKSLRRCPMPSPITISTIKNLYVNMFDISPQVLDNPHCLIYIRHKDHAQWEELQNISMVSDHCTLLLVDTPTGPAPSQCDSDINMPLTGSSQRSQGSGGSAGSQAVMESAASTNTPTGKLNGLWRAGRCQEVEDLTKLSDNLPIHPHPSHLHSNGDTSMTSPFSINSSTSGVSSDPPVDYKKLTTKAKSLQKNVLSLKKEVELMREEHKIKMAEFSRAMGQTSHRIAAAVSAITKTSGVSTKGGEMFRRERMELYGMEEGYRRCAEKTLRELRVLESAVEGMRVDVVQRRCKVDRAEVEALTLAVNTVGKSVDEIKGLYDPMETKMKKVMEKELQTIVSEENFLREERPKVEEAVEKQKNLQSILSTLMQFATVQSHRTPLIPVFPSIHNPDKETLIESIKAITPNHTHRLECLEMSETIQLKKKELYSPARKTIKLFESQLQIQRDHLKHRSVTPLEASHWRNVQLLFLEEKKERENKNREEFERKKKLEAMKREKEKKQMEELWRWQNRAQEKSEGLKMRQIRSQENVLRSAQDNGISYQYVADVRRKRVPNISRSDERLLESGNETQLHGRGPMFHVTRSDEQLLESGNDHHRLHAPLHVRTFSDDQTHVSTHSQSNGPSQPVRLRAAPKGRRFKKATEADLNKRKSFGYTGEFEDLQMYYDSIHPQTRHQSNDGVTGTKHLNNPSQSSFTSSTASSNGSKQPPGPSSLVSSRRGSSSKASSAIMNISGNRSDVSGASYTHHQSLYHPQQHAVAGGGGGGSVKHKHPMMNGFPNRYSMYEHHSQPVSEGDMDNISSNSFNKQPELVKQDPNLFRHNALTASHSSDSSKRRQSGQYSHKLRSNSDDSLFEHSTGQQPGSSHHHHHHHRHHDLSPTENRKWAMNIFNSDTLPVSKERKELNKGGNDDGSAQKLNNDAKASSLGRENTTGTSQRQNHSFHHSYTQHTPHGGKNRNSQSYPTDQAPQPSNITSHSGKSRIQYKPTDHHHHHHPNRQPHTHRHTTINSIPTHTHGIVQPNAHVPLRTTKSTQVPTSTHISSDARLTSYPRSYTAAMQSMHVRSSSNGRPLPSFGNQRGGASVGGRGNHVTHVHKPHPHHSVSNKDPMLGSLV